MGKFRINPTSGLRGDAIMRKGLRTDGRRTVSVCVKPEDHWSCIAHLIAEDGLKSAVIEEKKFKNIECK